ncbi:MAG: endo alpha-1,4 polygalactosaminidase [Deltaproteobacteria bacterium]|nr:endo alpha-1,4 polygalactosaminidase [Deltaproteobacteria bacterium]
MNRNTISILLLMSLFVFKACGGDDDSGDDEGDSSATDNSPLAGVCDSAAAGEILPSGTTWQWQLTGEIDRSVDVEMYDVDLFNTTAAQIEAIKGDGRFVVCYFSAGTWENWRDDAGQFDTAAIGKTMEEWDDEKWLDVRHASTREMVSARLDIAVEKGCDGVEPDNMDGYVNNTGFKLTATDQLSFNQFVAAEAHARQLSVGLKNDVDQLKALEGCYDWALNEECHAYDECDKYAPFVAAGKAVFHVEYVDDVKDGAALANDICGDTSLRGFSTLVKDWDLTEWYEDCL